MDCTHKVLNLMKEYRFNRTFTVIFNCNCISLIINFIVFMGGKMKGVATNHNQNQENGVHACKKKLTIARK